MKPGGPPGTAARGQARGGRRGVALLLATRGLPRWLLWTGAALTLLFVVLAIFADWIAPFGFNQYLAHGVRFPQQGPLRRHTGSVPQSTPKTSCPG